MSGGKFNFQDGHYPSQMLPQTDNILFVADLPEDCGEEDLGNFFKNYNFVVSRIIHNALRTHAFANFQTKEDAEKARRELNGVKITPKYSQTKIARPVRICKYENRSYLTEIDPRCNLLVKNLSKEVSAHMLFKTFLKYGDIRSSKLIIDYLGNSKGFGFVSFYKVEDAIKATEELNGKEIGGKNIKVNFLEKGRKKEVKKNNIYVKHFPKKDFDHKNLEELFSKFGEIKSAVVLKDDKGESKGFGFVCFANPEDAQKALDEMNDKKIFDDINETLYVSFALKKGERKEQLLKKRIEMYKQSRKMTIYAKIKDENAIKNEEEFTEQIKHYLKELISEDFKPRRIKVRFESKNAFITMNSKKEAEDFYKKFQAYSKDVSTILYFNLYVARVDRVSASSYFRKYNQFSETASLASKNSKYVSYNNFDDSSASGSNVHNRSKNYYNNQEQKKYKNYNNFDDNIDKRQCLMKLDKTEITDTEDAGEIIYEIVEKMYGDEAGRITGMLIELSIDRLNNMLINDQSELKRQIDKAHALLKEANQQQ